MIKMRATSMPLVQLALCLVFIFNVPHVHSGWVNGYDQSFAFTCPKGQFLRSIVSQHHNGFEDRRFDLTCAGLPPLKQRRGSASCGWSDYVNNFDEVQVYECPGEQYMAGLGSYHDNGYEDRRFRFYCCGLPTTIVHSCAYSGWVNGFDQVATFHVPGGRVLRGMISYHSNGAEDRRFQFQHCKISNS